MCNWWIGPCCSFSLRLKLPTGHQEISELRNQSPIIDFMQREPSGHKCCSLVGASFSSRVYLSEQAGFHQHIQGGWIGSKAAQNVLKYLLGPPPLLAPACPAMAAPPLPAGAFVSQSQPDVGSRRRKTHKEHRQIPLGMYCSELLSAQ